MYRWTPCDTKWEYGKGIFLTTAAQAQGACGFLKSAGSIQLPSITISSDMEFGSIVAVAMDGKPIAESGKVLLQVMSEQRNAGWQAEGPEGQLKTIKSVGEMPIQYRTLAGSVILSGKAPSQIRVFDWNGKEKKTLPASDTIQLDPALDNELSGRVYMTAPGMNGEAKF
jgi:hypothetical protein